MLWMALGLLHRHPSAIWVDSDLLVTQALSVWCELPNHKQFVSSQNSSLSHKTARSATNSLFSSQNSSLLPHVSSQNGIERVVWAGGALDPGSTGLQPGSPIPRQIHQHLRPFRQSAPGGFPPHYNTTTLQHQALQHCSTKHYNTTAPHHHITKHSPPSTTTLQHRITASQALQHYSTKHSLPSTTSPSTTTPHHRITSTTSPHHQAPQHHIISHCKKTRTTSPSTVPLARPELIFRSSHFTHPPSGAGYANDVGAQGSDGGKA